MLGNVLKFLEQLDHRIIQAPIGSAASVELAAAVSNAGGLGSLALSWTTPQAAQHHVRELKRLTNRPFAVNFVLAFQAKALEAVLSVGVPVVTFSWGINLNLIKKAHDANAIVGIQVGSENGAFQALLHGADFLICQGMEAGGHVQSSTSLNKLLPKVLNIANKTPVFAAGGLADHNDFSNVLSIGAAGAMLGTRFVATLESQAHPAYKQAIVDAEGNATAFTGCFDGGWPYANHRVLRNQTLENWEAAGSPPNGQRPGENEIVAVTANNTSIARYHNNAPIASFSGEVLDLALYAGTGATRINSILPAKEVINSLSKSL